ncbi:MAG: hypothetical protein WBW93_03120 [Steroidobacteraceae bacterium]
MLGGSEDLKRQAEFTFAAARHALVHTAAIFRIGRPTHIPDRLSEADFGELCRLIGKRRTALRTQQVSRAELDQLRALYEPWAQALSSYFLMNLPPWINRHPAADNWRVSLPENPGDTL